jgi:hypothetical protein
MTVGATMSVVLDLIKKTRRIEDHNEHLMFTKEKVERDETRCDVVKESRPLEKDHVL